MPDPPERIGVHRVLRRSVRGSAHLALPAPGDQQGFPQRCSDVRCQRSRCRGGRCSRRGSQLLHSRCSRGPDSPLDHYSEQATRVPGSVELFRLIERRLCLSRLQPGNARPCTVQQLRLIIRAGGGETAGSRRGNSISRILDRVVHSSLLARCAGSRKFQNSREPGENTARGPSRSPEAAEWPLRPTNKSRFAQIIRAMQIASAERRPPGSAANTPLGRGRRGPAPEARGARAESVGVVQINTGIGVPQRVIHSHPACLPPTQRRAGR